MAIHDLLSYIHYTMLPSLSSTEPPTVNPAIPRLLITRSSPNPSAIYELGLTNVSTWLEGACRHSGLCILAGGHGHGVRTTLKATIDAIRAEEAKRNAEAPAGTRFEGSDLAIIEVSSRSKMQHALRCADNGYLVLGISRKPSIATALAHLSQELWDEIPTLASHLLAAHAQYLVPTLASHGSRRIALSESALIAGESDLISFAHGRGRYRTLYEDWRQRFREGVVARNVGDLFELPYSPLTH